VTVRDYSSRHKIVNNQQTTKTDTEYEEYGMEIANRIDRRDLESIDAEIRKRGWPSGAASGNRRY
jgi:hypothetical protein